MSKKTHGQAATEGCLPYRWEPPPGRQGGGASEARAGRAGFGFRVQGFRVLGLGFRV